MGVGLFLMGAKQDRLTVKCSLEVNWFADYGTEINVAANDNNVDLALAA